MSRFVAIVGICVEAVVVHSILVRYMSITPTSSELSCFAALERLRDPRGLGGGRLGVRREQVFEIKAAIRDVVRFLPGYVMEPFSRRSRLGKC